MPRIELVPPSKRDGQIITVRKYNIPGNGYYDIAGGYLHDIPQVWRLIRAYIVLTTDATVANRYARIRRVSDELEDMGGVLTNAITASSVGGIQVAGYISANATGFTLSMSGVHPDTFLIQGKSAVKFDILDGVAGDVWNFIAEFQYMNRLLVMEDIVPSNGIS